MLAKRWFAIRADAGENIGIGHVMRCLALAEWALEQGIYFVLFTKHIPEFIETKVSELGGVVVELEESAKPPGDRYAHSTWLKGNELEDAEQTNAALLSYQSEQGVGVPLFIMVDHYALADPWEKMLKEIAPIFVVDDLNDRLHDCDWLLDQTVGKSSENYRDLVPEKCRLLMGPRYALLRPEFTKRGEASSVDNDCFRVLVSLGGVDQNNVSKKIVCAIVNSDLSELIRIKVLTSSLNPNLGELKAYCSGLKGVELVVDSNDMSGLLARHDLCIGAAGSTSWERCAMAIPSLMYVLAENQRSVAENLMQEGAVINLGDAQSLDEGKLVEAISSLMNDEERYCAMKSNALKVCDGFGGQRVIDSILGCEIQ